MKNLVRCVVLLVVIGLAAIPAWAAELRMTGFLDSAFPHFESNISPPSPDGDSDVTRGNDQHTLGRTRGRMYFNMIASDDLRAVFGFAETKMALHGSFWGLGAGLSFLPGR